MATQDVQILKQSGTIAVRCANGNLRIPGFKLLEHCNTTVDMDEDPEVFMMLEPVLIVRNLNKAVPNNDIRDSARRLRFIFKAVILFFRWRLPAGEKTLHENGIDNLPDEVFEDIKAALVQSDKHFLRFSAMAIKRCLQLFTANVMDHARTALPTGKGDTTVRDLAREAWEAVKHFRAMLTQDWSTILELNGSVTAGPSTTAGPPTAMSQNVQQSNSTTAMDETSPYFADSDDEGQTAIADQDAPTSAPTTRGRGGGRGRATKARGSNTATRGRGGREDAPSRQDDMNIDGPSSPIQDIIFPNLPRKGGSRRAKPSTTSVLGKHQRAEPHLDKAKEARPTVRQKIYDNVFEAARAGTEAREAYYERTLEEIKAKRDDYADRAWVLAASHQQLIGEAFELRRRVRNFEKEKKEALSNQLRQLRPGLVTMKMTPSVQRKVIHLFGLGDSGSGANAAVPGSSSQGASINSGRIAGVDTNLLHVEDQKMPKSTLSQGQEELKTGSHLPPVGYFRHPTPSKSNEMPKRQDLGAQTSPCKTKTRRRWNTEAKNWEYYDSDDESDTPTESSSASTISE